MAEKKWVHECQVAGDKYGVPPALIWAVIQEESGGQATVVSKAGAVGLMQVIPGIHSCGKTKEQLLNPKYNVDCGALILRSYHDATDRDWSSETLVKRALAAYNWGPGNVMHQPKYDDWPPETQRYADIIWKLYQEGKEGTVWKIPS